MTIPTKRLDALDPTVNPQRDHEVAAMRDGISNKLRVEQILALLQSSDIPGEAVTLAKLADDARAASGHTFNDTTAQLGETDVQGAIEALAVGYRLRSAPILITSSGTYTPDAEVKAILIEPVAAGGSGAGTSALERPMAGGNAGSRALSFIVNPPTLTISIGAGATGSSGSGANGGDTTVTGTGVTINCPGGRGGARGGAGSAEAILQPANNPATGGNILNIAGNTGGDGLSVGGSTTAGAQHFSIGGYGGTSPYGAAGGQRIDATFDSGYSRAGKSATGYGAGGGGATHRNSGSDALGGNGANGIVRIWEFI